MSATAERRRTSPAKRVEILERERDRRQEKLAAALAEIETLKASRSAVVAESLRADPTKSAFERGALASEGERREAALETTARHLREEIGALEADLAAVSVELAERQLGEATIQAKRLTEDELESIRKLGSLLAAMVPSWNDRVRVARERAALAARVRSDNLEQIVGGSRPDLLQAWQAVAVPPIEPAPRTFAECLQEAVVAATGGRSSDEDPKHLDELNRHRATLGLAAEVRPVAPSRATAEACYPDLRQEVRDVDGAPPSEPSQMASGQIEGLASAGFGRLGAVIYRSDGGAVLPPAA